MTYITRKTQVDDSTIEYVNNKIQVKDASIDTAKIADNAVTQIKTDSDLYANAEYIASDDLLTAADTTRGGLLATLYTKIKEIAINARGNYRIKFDADGGTNSGSSNCRIYKNGVAYGTERTLDNSAGMETFSEDLDFEAGDTCELWYKKDGGQTVSVENFRVYGKITNIPTVTTD